MAKCSRSHNKGAEESAGRKMIKANSPKKLWDDCIELEMEIRSCTANNVFELKSEGPKTVMKGETANITHLHEFGWYDWVYFRDNAVTYPNDKWVLGRWLGPALILAQHYLQRSYRKMGDVCTDHHTGT